MPMSISELKETARLSDTWLRKLLAAPVEAKLILKARVGYTIVYSANFEEVGAPLADAVS